jgi:hypothetical protein
MFLIALMAAVMLVIGGAPTRADASGCDPCPPDCPMMQALAKAAAHKAAKGQPTSQNPCKPSPLCQTAVQASAPAPAAEPIGYPKFAVAVRHVVANGVDTPSRPPDRNLRPPIQL